MGRSGRALDRVVGPGPREAGLGGGEDLAGLGLDDARVELGLLLGDVVESPDHHGVDAQDLAQLLGGLRVQQAAGPELHLLERLLEQAALHDLELAAFHEKGGEPLLHDGGAAAHGALMVGEAQHGHALDRAVLEPGFELARQLLQGLRRGGGSQQGEE